MVCVLETRAVTDRLEGPVRRADIRHHRAMSVTCTILAVDNIRGTAIEKQSQIVLCALNIPLLSRGPRLI